MHGGQNPIEPAVLGCNILHGPYIQNFKEIYKFLEKNKISKKINNVIQFMTVLKKNFKLGRVRILLKEPRSTLSWHRDPEPRLHIPIITNPGCRMVIGDVAKHMPADGTITITNNIKYHNFFNGGEQERIHLVACVLENPFENHGRN